MTTPARGFPAFTPRSRYRARTWWGTQWAEAVEHTSRDNTLLTRARSYARRAHLGPITLSPGHLTATVTDTRGDDHHTTVTLTTLTPTEQDRLTTQLTSQAGHLAALLDGHMPHDLVDAAADVDIALLPSIGELESTCDCTDYGDLCTHAAALCYQTAWLLDDDPLLLLLLRGKTPTDLLGDPHTRRHTTEPTGTPPDQAFTSTPAALPHIPAPGALPRNRPALPPHAQLDTAALDELITNTAEHARSLLATHSSDSNARPPADNS